MDKPAESSVTKAVDSIQQCLTDYAGSLGYDGLTLEAIHAAKVRVIDTLGALIAGFFNEPCRIARNVAAQMPNPEGATIIGTRMKTTPDMAAFVNATTARFAELNDSYQGPASSGHPSDVLTPVLAVAEFAQVGGREFVTSVVLAYEVFLRIADVFHNLDFDQTNFCCLGTAVAAGKLLGLSPSQLSHCISMAVVPNVVLRQVRAPGYLSMFKTAASGQAARAGVFAALLARAGMEGPHLPFEGKAGWCDHVARERFSLKAIGGNGTSFKITDTLIKERTGSGHVIPSIFAAEKVAKALKSIKDVKQVTVEVYLAALENGGIGEHYLNPDSRDSADHSIPYVVATSLMDGTVTPRSFDDAHLWNPERRALMQKVKVIESEEFTKAYNRQPREASRSRVTVVTSSGEQLVGESGGDQDDMAAPKSDAKIAQKFRGLTEELLGVKQVNAILDRLWHLEDLKNAAAIPSMFILD